jgi:Flp pilus assembly protein TadB
VAIWLFALVAMITIGILFVTKVVGSWALLVGSGIVVAVALLRYRAETERAKRNADDHDE